MEAEFNVTYDSQGRITRVTYKNDRTEDPDGRTQIEILEFLATLGLTPNRGPWYAKEENREDNTSRREKLLFDVHALRDDNTLHLTVAPHSRGEAIRREDSKDLGSQLACIYAYSYQDAVARLMRCVVEAEPQEA